MTIIGVVAALTIPTLMTKYQKHQYVVGLKNAYSELQNAVKMIPIAEGCSAGDMECVGWNNSDNIDGLNFYYGKHQKRAYLLSKQFKNSQLDLTGTGACKNYKQNGLSLMLTDTCFIANDGKMWSFYGDASTAIVDINGKKGPNKLARDVFLLEVNNDATVVPYKDDTSTLECDPDDLGNAMYCAAKVLKEDAMNY